MRNGATTHCSFPHLLLDYIFIYLKTWTGKQEHTEKKDSRSTKWIMNDLIFGNCLLIALAPGGGPTMNPMLHFFPCQVRKQLHKKWSRYSFPWQFHMACQLNYAKCHPQCYYRDYHSANTQTHINTYKHIHPSLSQHKLLNFHCTFSNVFNSTVHILVSEKSIGQKSMLSSSISLSSGI